MLEGLLRLFAPRPLTQILRDVVDIVVVAWIIYRALLVLRGTRAIQMAVGLGFVLLVYLGAKIVNFVTLLNLLSWLLSSIILIVVVVFQNDIRRALIRMGGTAWFTGGREQQSRVIDEVVAAATELARHRMGALIAFEQDANVLEFAKSEGIPLESVVTRELLVSLFVPESVNKLHDGAVLIRDLKIARAGVFFPMPDTKILDAQLGSRHRAALGITEETDAVVVVVSEERGTISFCFSGNIVSNLDGQSLRHALLGLFGRGARKKQQQQRLGKKVSTTTSTASPPKSVTSKAITLPAARVSAPTPLGTMKSAAIHDTGKFAALPRTVMPLGEASPTGTPLPSLKSVSTPMRAGTPAGTTVGEPPPPSTAMPPTTLPRPPTTFVPTSKPETTPKPPGGEAGPALKPPSDDV